MLDIICCPVNLKILLHLFQLTNNNSTINRLNSEINSLKNEKNSIFNEETNYYEKKIQDLKSTVDKLENDKLNLNDEVKELTKKMN